MLVGCDSKFKYLNNLTTHKKSHENPKANSSFNVASDIKKVFKCERCSEIFEKKGNLLSHQKNLCDFTKYENRKSLVGCTNEIEIESNPEIKTRLVDEENVFLASSSSLLHNTEKRNIENDNLNSEKTKTQYYSHSSIDDCIQKPKKMKHTHVININSGN
jgi:hypothetical protein